MFFSSIKFNKNSGRKQTKQAERNTTQEACRKEEGVSVVNFSNTIEEIHIEHHSELVEVESYAEDMVIASYWPSDVFIDLVKNCD